MKYQVDHDVHIHSFYSLCSNDKEQMPTDILRHAKENNLKYICLTDHYWDEKVEGPSNWYSFQDTAHIEKALPLPKDDQVKFYFGCETDLREDLTLGVSKEALDRLDFIIIPTTHLHMKGFTIKENATFEEHARAFVKRMDAVLDMDLPFSKIGIAHLTTRLGSPDAKNPEDYLKFVSDEEFHRLFKKAKEKGVGIELNYFDCFRFEEFSLHVFKIAKEEGCKFYLGSDAHHPKDFANTIPVFERFVELLQLTEDDKFIPSTVKL